MIYYFVMAQQAHAMQSFLTSWGSALASRIQIITYESILSGHTLSPQNGNYIFTNLNSVRRLALEARSKIQVVHDRLFEKLGAGRVLNNPSRALSRYELLRELHQRGFNGFNAYRLEDTPQPQRYPVFIRNQAGTEYVAPRLLRDEEEFGATVRGLKWQTPDAISKMIAVEFCNTADSAGIYRKYGAFVIGHRIIPRHLFFSKSWLVKLADVAEPSMIAEELAFLDENPHTEELLGCARVAGISYGRIDYGLQNGRLQIWEINTNAMLASAVSSAIPARQPAHLKFVAMITAAFADFDANERAHG